MERLNTLVNYFLVEKLDEAKTLVNLLTRRAQSISEVDELTRQNAELKSLLNQYLGDNATNAAFRVPPAQVLCVCDCLYECSHNIVPCLCMCMGTV